MGDTKKAIKQEIKAIYKNVLADLTEAEQQLTSEEKIELRSYIEELSEGNVSSFVPVFIRKKIKELVRCRDGNCTSDKGDIRCLVEDDIVPEKYYVNNLQKWHDIMVEHTKNLDEKSESTFYYVSGIITGLLIAGKINDNEKFALDNAFDQSNYYIEDGELKSAEQ